MTSIGTGAFCRTINCTKVVNYLPDSVTSLGNSAFAYCGARQDLFLRGFVGAAGRGIFYRSNIRSVTFGPAFTGIGDTSNKMRPFQGCSSITNIVFSPDASPFSIVANGFNGTNATLSKPLILYKVTSVGGSAFNGMKIPTIVFDDGIQSVGDFYKVTLLTEVRFLGAPPSSATGTWADYGQSTSTAVKTYIPWKFRQQWWPYAAEYVEGTTYTDSNAPIRLEGKTPTSTFSSAYVTTPAKRPLYLADSAPTLLVIFY